MLLKQLFDGYNPAARPVINSSSTVDVKMMFSLLQIQELVGRVACVYDVTVLTLVTSEIFLYTCIRNPIKLHEPLTK